jgi:hypothetical protein
MTDHLISSIFNPETGGNLKGTLINLAYALGVVKNIEVGDTLFIRMVGKNISIEERKVRWAMDVTQIETGKEAISKIHKIWPEKKNWFTFIQCTNLRSVKPFDLKECFPGTSAYRSSNRVAICEEHSQWIRANYL